MNTLVCAASLTPKYLGLQSINCKTIVTHNKLRHWRVHFYAFVRHLFSNIIQHNRDVFIFSQRSVRRGVAWEQMLRRQVRRPDRVGGPTKWLVHGWLKKKAEKRAGYTGRTTTTRTRQIAETMRPCLPLKAENTIKNHFSVVVNLNYDRNRHWRFIYRRFAIYTLKIRDKYCEPGIFISTDLHICVACNS